MSVVTQRSIVVVVVAVRIIEMSSDTGQIAVLVIDHSHNTPSPAAVNLDACSTVSDRQVTGIHRTLLAAYKFVRQIYFTIRTVLG